MNDHATCLLAALAACAAMGSDAAPRTRDAMPQGNRAVIVVTGMRVDENPENFRKDVAVAEGARVKVTARDGTVRERKTEPFSKPGGKGGGHFTADFDVELDAVYTIEMTFRDGTVVRIEDYRLPREWRTHFFFHSTVGTLSPSAILRVGEDPRTRQRCCVYAVYPLDSYRQLGGRQVREDGSSP